MRARRGAAGRRTRRLAMAGVLAAVAVLGLSACSAGGASPSRSASPTGATFTNPIKETGADPYVTQWHGSYYLIESRDGGIWVTRSPKNDLTDIASGTAVKIWSYPSDGPSCADVWAPELHLIDGRWYVYYAATTCDKDNRNHRMFALRSSSDDPQGSFTEAGKVADAADRWAIDGTRFTWKGTAYFVWSGWPGGTDGRQNLYIAKMSSPTKLVGTGVLLSEPTFAFERHGTPINEGPEALVHGGSLHIVYSASGSWTDFYGYGLLTATGDDLLERTSWKKSATSVFATDKDVTSPGHGSFVRSPDGRQDWMIYHSARFPGAGWDRQIDAQRYTWRSDGTPDFGSPLGEDVQQAVPSGQKSSS